MFQILTERFRQGYRTSSYPAEPAPARPSRFQGLPKIDQPKCSNGCQKCIESCPTEAIRKQTDHLQLDWGKCLFCTECVQVCPEGTIAFTDEYRMSTRSRTDIVIGEQESELAEPTALQ